VGVEVLLAVALIALIAGQLLGQPMLLAFVETGSMEPTLDAGDGFVAIPMALSGPPAEGDVVVFEASDVGNGGLTTHRIVDRTERGYITKGDANPFTDQDDGEPPVKEAQISAKALQVGGGVVEIPHLGAVIVGVRGVLTSVQQHLSQLTGAQAFLGPQGIAYSVAVLAGLLYLLDFLVAGGPGKDRDRSRTRESGLSIRTIAVLLALFLVLSATAAMVAPAGTHQFGVVSATFESENPTVIERGESATISYPLPNAGLLPVHVYLEPASQGVTTSPRHSYVPARSETTAAVRLSAPERTGYYRRFVTEHRYLAVLPGPAIAALHEFHPWAPILVIDALLAAGCYAVFVGLLGTRRIRRRTRDSPGGAGLFP
jgi:signal peptidase